MKDPALLAGVAVFFGCLFVRKSPNALLLHSTLLARASWLLAREMAEGAWARRGRWEECKDRAWRER